MFAAAAFLFAKKKMPPDTIAARLNAVLADIASCAERSGRSSQDVRLIAVTKTKPLDMVLEAWQAGQQVFGENKVQELLEKQPQLPQAQWHLIGTLQTNKVKQAIGRVAIIHSVDSVKLMQEVQRQAEKHGRTQEVLLQVNISAEDSKHGIAPAELETLIAAAAEAPNVLVRGLMGIASLADDPVLWGREFAGLRQLRDSWQTAVPANVQLTELSMGMSSDYEIAIAEGATYVRVGSAIFGHR